MSCFEKLCHNYGNDRCKHTHPRSNFRNRFPGSLRSIKMLNEISLPSKSNFSS